MLTSLKAILRGAARSLGVERAANAALIEEMWGDIVGAAAAAHSRVASVRGTVVLADTEAGPWIQELSAQRARYVAEINRRLGGAVVTDIRFRPTSAHPALFGGADPRRDTGGQTTGHPAAGEGGEELPLTAEDAAAVERAVSEIGDPEIREGARRVMVSQLRWRRRRDTGAGER
jgi:hypothetical protein